MSGRRGGKYVASSSIGFGAVLAIVMSWTVNKAILWAIFHGIIGWIYVIYYLLFHSDWTWF
jgi:CHASE2 domain-containing sensor protein